MTRHLAVLGSPIEHSKSPAIHTAAYRTLQLNWDYGRVELDSHHLLQFLETLDSDWLGLSLTMPLKEEASRLANERTELAETTGVANTLLRTTSGWRAYNTDVFGIKRALAAVDASKVSKVVILGSGATATSTVFAVAQLYPDAKITVLARNTISLAQLQARAKANSIRISVANFAKLKSKASRADVVISTLPSSAHATVAKKLRGLFFKANGTLLDVAYDPWPSALVSNWQKAGGSVVNGVEMLLWQAIAQIRVFEYGNVETELPNERAVELSMRHALGLI